MAAKRKSPKKPRSAPAKGVAYGIADAEHVDEALNKHWSKVQAKGVDREMQKVFVQTIQEARTHDLPGKRVSISSRETLQDLIGDFRDAADLASDGMNGVDAALRTALRADGDFPETDAELEKYVTGLPEIVEANAAILARHDFKKDKATALLKAIPKYLVDLKTKPLLQGKAAAQAKDRAAIFKRLRNQTRFLRKVGRTALKNSPDRADFDRVVVNEAAQKKSRKNSAVKAKTRRAAAKAAKKPDPK